MTTSPTSHETPRNAGQTAVTAPLTDRDVWIFDLDNTLYPASCKLFDQIDRNMSRFIAQLMEIPEPDARVIQKTYFRDYGTTMRGLMTEHGVEARDFLNFVHDIDLTPVDASPRLERALDALPGRKVIFTNGDVPHAERVMRKLGVDHHFEGVFDIVAADYVPKPASETYARMVAHFEIAPKRAVMIEDMARNLKPAHDLGMATVWVQTDCDHARAQSEGAHIHHVTTDLANWLEDLVAA